MAYAEEIQQQVARVTIYKDDFTPSRPWCADVEFYDNTIWYKWQASWKSKKAMMENISCTWPGEVDRGVDR